MKKIFGIAAAVLLSFGFIWHDAEARSSTEAAFSPSVQAVTVITDAIGAAESSVDVAAYSFSSPKVADALIAAYQRGVAVRVVLDKTHAKRRYDAVVSMYEAGIPIRVNHRYAIMHNKYLIIDDETIQTGSFNYTVSAEKRNAENVVLIKHNKRLAKKYRKNWQQLWDEAEVE
jgi:phosphatidylserine/phosphatidylglycerophosphate/cardiolipin synthase-like enzyme